MPWFVFFTSKLILVVFRLPEHKRDAARAEDALTLSYGSELIGMQRDWNEELQSCREFPHTTPQERYLIFGGLVTVILIPLAFSVL